MSKINFSKSKKSKKVTLYSASLCPVSEALRCGPSVTGDHTVLRFTCHGFISYGFQKLEHYRHTQSQSHNHNHNGVFV